MTVVTPRVLVVSESRITRRVVEMTFADQPVELVMATSGQAGVDAWDAQASAVVLVDASMAPPDGVAVARHVQATSAGRPAAVLIMAGQHDTVDAVAIAAADVRGVLRKPLDSLQLIEAIREALRTARAPRSSQPSVAHGAAQQAGATPSAGGPEPGGGRAASTVASRDETPVVLGDDDLERVAARVAAIWSGDRRHADAVQAMVAARADDLAATSAASAVAAVERLAPAAASEAAERLVRELAPALVQQVARLVVADVSERLVREEIARMRSAHLAR